MYIFTCTHTHTQILDIGMRRNVHLGKRVGVKDQPQPRQLLQPLGLLAEGDVRPRREAVHWQHKPAHSVTVALHSKW